ncbi:arylsulfatase B-like [Brevipalpus obovatus]|uniref:arylsulfatase B-like n=1 Tax=Brevipalpus obovatus TaxID=246614 RepID=UPI003D9E6A22
MFFALVWLFFLIILRISANHTNKPNIIIFLADDLGWDDVSFHGSKQIRTPNIDRLAREGVVLNNYYTGPLCTPSRGSLLSGYHPIHSGTQHWVILPQEPRGLPLNFTLLPEYLRDYDYANHIVGKWHLGSHRRYYTPTYRGFDSHVGYFNGGNDYYDHTTLSSSLAWGIDFRRNLNLNTNASGIYSTHYYTDEALKIIENHPKHNQPLFLYMAYQSVHTGNTYSPLQAPKEYIDRFPNINHRKRKIFAGMLSAMDDSIGIIMESLQHHDMLQNSIICFMSDNGGPANGFMGNFASNWPLRGVKDTLWEGGVRVPALIWSPVLKKKSYVFQGLFHVSDWLPTLLTAIDRNKVSRDDRLRNIYGKWKLVQGLKYPDWRDWYFPPGSSNSDISVNLVAQETSSDHLQRSFPVQCGTKPQDADTNCKSEESLCLYDIENDPCEYHNLAGVHQDVVNQLWNRILELNRTAIPPMNKPLDPASDPKYHNYAWTCWLDPKY